MNTKSVSSAVQKISNIFKTSICKIINSSWGGSVIRIYRYKVAKYYCSDAFKIEGFESSRPKGHMIKQKKSTWKMQPWLWSVTIVETQ
jgi:hypothetical protein